jgi:hypothetical protein
VTLEDRIEGLIRERTCTRAEYHALRRYRSFQRRGGAPLPADFYLASACLNGAAVSDRLFPIEDVPEVPLLPPRARKGPAAGTNLDARFLNDYPSEWTCCPTCGGAERSPGPLIWRRCRYFDPRGRAAASPQHGGACLSGLPRHGQPQGPRPARGRPPLRPLQAPVHAEGRRDDARGRAVRAARVPGVRGTRTDPDHHRGRERGSPLRELQGHRQGLERVVGVRRAVRPRRADPDVRMRSTPMVVEGSMAGERRSGRATMRARTACSRSRPRGASSPSTTSTATRRTCAGGTSRPLPAVPPRNPGEGRDGARLPARAQRVVPPHAAGYYAWVYLGEELTREETRARMDELLARWSERPAGWPCRC